MVVGGRERTPVSVQLEGLLLDMECKSGVQKFLVQDSHSILIHNVACIPNTWIDSFPPLLCEEWMPQEVHPWKCNHLPCPMRCGGNWGPSWRHACSLFSHHWCIEICHPHCPLVLIHPLLQFALHIGGMQGILHTGYSILHSRVYNRKSVQLPYNYGFYTR